MSGPNHLVPLPKVGFKHPGVLGCDPAKAAATWRPARPQGQPAVDHHVPHLLGFEVEHGELEEVVGKQAFFVEPTASPDDAVALVFALGEPSAPGHGIDGKRVARIAHESVWRQKHHPLEQVRGGGPPMEGDTPAEAVADERAVEGQSFGGAESNQSRLPGCRLEGAVVTRGPAMGRQMGHEQGRPRREQGAHVEHVFKRPAEAVQGNGHAVRPAFRHPDAEFDVDVP